MRLEKILSRSRIIDVRSLDLEGALEELLATCVGKFPDLKPRPCSAASSPARAR